MSEERFNEFAGKVVNAAELDEKLARRSILAGAELNGIEDALVYLSRKAVAELHRQIGALLNGAETPAANNVQMAQETFIEVLPLLQALEAKENPLCIIAAFAAAASECADYQSRIGRDLLSESEAVDAVTSFETNGVPANYLPPSALWYWQKPVSTSAGVMPGYWHKPIEAPWVYR